MLLSFILGIFLKKIKPLLVGKAVPTIFKIGILNGYSYFKIDFEACNFIKKRLPHSCFPVNITKILITAFSIKHFQWKLLCMDRVRLFKGCKTTLRHRATPRAFPKANISAVCAEFPVGSKFQIFLNSLR